ncbi:probable WRKY transcription factor 75 [Impatiens glandulifera]|uniref:probable WRKY transcription factor 75 n=1 Tax=Impatiens glandulifera TaxID=253017 RepID=UPI001FB08501|nr:probable WRKY transcription factor 75 [Impatiens glandulifera]
MENYQLLFPSSSSGNMLNSYIDYRESHGNGFIGLMQSMGVIDSDHTHMLTSDSSKRNNMDIDDEDDDYEEEEKSVGKTVIKKEEKKKKNKTTKEPRYAFETRSQVDILDDGYRWRKYGQKAVKNNKFPRSYYRCTQQGCNVKKQVQRLSRDEGIVVTTYEGIHSHPLDKSTDNFENILTQLQIYSTSH